MRVLLTGSSGWLGRFLAPRLRAAGHVVIGLDVAPGADTHVIGSVANRAVVERAFSDQGAEAVIHAGALHKPDIVRVSAQAFVEVNVTGTLNLLQAAAAAGHDRFVFTSTTSLMISAPFTSSQLNCFGSGLTSTSFLTSPAAAIYEGHYHFSRPRRPSRFAENVRARSAGRCAYS